MKCLPYIDEATAMESAKRVIATGGPGAGKTTVLDTLKIRGYPIVEESARDIIRGQIRRDLPPRSGLREFAMKVMRSDITNYRSIEPADIPFCFKA